MQDNIIRDKIMQDGISATDISSHVLDRIETILKETMGLHSASIGSMPIANAVQRRMSICAQCADINIDADAYLAQLLASDEELDALIEDVVVPETWFFRNHKAFDALQHFVSKEWLPLHAQEQLRVLSLPCSTGEEPYSIVMALIDAGLQNEQFHLDAIDISAQALSGAHRAVYSDNSFRSNNLVFRDRFFRNTSEGYLLNETIRQNVNFIHANMLDEAFMPGEDLYDVIFCRNVMIYFDPIAQGQAIGVLSRLLKPTGILFVGHAESGIILKYGYVSEHMQQAFAFRKGESEPYIKPDDHQRDIKHKKEVGATLQSPPCPHPLSRTPLKFDETPLLTNSLEQAFRLANEGSLVKATRMCENWLKHNEPNVDAYYLLGLIHEAAGHGQQAEEYLRKVLYLQPDHEEALVHLALLMEQKGDSSAAEILYQRARRAVEKRAVSQHHSHTGIY